MGTDEELEPRVLDYMLFYVFKRSESHEKMKYSTLLDLLDSIIRERENSPNLNRPGK